jgi:adenylate cyclase class 2
MKSEIEAKFLDVNFDEIRTKLIGLGGVCEQPMRLMRRVTIDNDFMNTGKSAFLRVRDEGHKITMTYKQFDERSVDGAKEIEVEVSDFDATVALLAQAGLPHRSFQESKRETWRIGEVEVVLDEWPWLKPYIEIEGHSKEAIAEIAAKLGFDWDNAIFGSVMSAFRAEYPHLGYNDTVGVIPSVKFGDPVPDLLKP